jgi:hypothetical protein
MYFMINNKMKGTTKFGAVLMLAVMIAATATASDPLGLNLPATPVTMTLSNPGATSYFNVKFEGIAAGYDVRNINYPGWCADANHTIGMGTQTARLYSTYDTALPSYAQNADWDKITYMVNKYRANGYSCANTQGYEIQSLVWDYMGLAYSWGPVDATCKATIKADVEANGNNFVPGAGDIATVLVDTNVCGQTNDVIGAATFGTCVQTKQIIFVEIPFPAPELTSALAAIALVSPAFGYLLVKRKK